MAKGIERQADGWQAPPRAEIVQLEPEEFHVAIEPPTWSVSVTRNVELRTPCDGFTRKKVKSLADGIVAGGDPDGKTATEKVYAQSAREVPFPAMHRPVPLPIARAVPRGV